MGLPCFKMTTFLMEKGWGFEDRIYDKGRKCSKGRGKTDGKHSMELGEFCYNSLALLALFVAKLLSTCKWGCCGFADPVQSD